MSMSGTKMKTKMKSQGMVLEFEILSSLKKVFPNVKPVEDMLSHVIAKNESFNFQIALKNVSGTAVLENIRITVKGELAKYISFQTVGFVPVTYTNPEMESDDYYLDGCPGLFPDILKPIGPFGIVLPMNQWRSVWVKMEAQDHLPTGIFDVTFEIVNHKDEKLAELIYPLEIIDTELPKSDLIVTNWMHYDCIAQKHNVVLFEKDFYCVFEKYLKAYIQAGNTMLLIPMFTPPLDTQVGSERLTAQLVKVDYFDGKYTFDFSALETFIRFVTSRGIKYLELSHLFTQWGGERCPKIIANTKDGEKRIFGWETDSQSEEYAEFLRAFLPKLYHELERWGVRENCFVHLTDEPSEAHLETYKKCHAMVKPYIGDMPIMDALSEYKFYELGLIDVPTPITSSYDDTYSKHGVTDNFVYYCCVPVNRYYSNRIINMPSLRTRILGVRLYASGVKGFLHWGFNFFQTKLSIEEVDPYSVTDGGGFFPAGDAFIVYPNKQGLYHSIRLELMRECFQDYRALKALERKIGREKVLQKIKDWGLAGFNVYPHSDIDFVRFREWIYEELKGV